MTESGPAATAAGDASIEATSSREEPVPPPDAPPAPPRPFSPARLLVRSLACAAVLWVLSTLTEFRTKVTLTVEPNRIEWDVDGWKIEAPVGLYRVTGISLRSAASPFAMGAGDLVVESDGQVLLRERLPRIFDVKGGDIAPVGDWWVDERFPMEEVRPIQVSLRPSYTLRATFTGRCLKFTALRLEQSGGPPVTVSFRRGLINNDSYIERDAEVLKGGGMPVDPKRCVIAAIDIVLRGLLAAALIAAAFAALCFVPVAAGPLARLAELTTRRRLVAAGTAVLLAATFAVTAWVAVSVLEKVVHTPDEVVYQLQARWLRAGKLYQAKPVHQRYFTIPFTFVKGDRWLTQYPIGWPMILALGDLLGAPWLVNPLLAVVALALLLKLGADLGGPRLALLAGAIAVLSPMWNLMFGSRLAHGATTCALLGFAWLFLRSLRTGARASMAVAGLALGIAAGMRPLTALAMTVPFGLFWLFDGTARRHIFRLSVPLAAGTLAGLAPVLYANYRTTGKPLLFAYSYVGGHFISFAHLHQSLTFLDSTLASTLPALTGWGWGVLNGWPALVLPLGIALVPFLLGRATRHDALLAGVFASLPLAYLLHDSYGLHGYGPRFYFEGFFAVYLLAARGLLELARLGAEAGRRLPLWTAAAAAVLLLGWSAATLPTRLAAYRGYNGVSGDLERALREKDVTRGLVLLPPEDWYDWGRVVNLLPADLDAELVFAQRHGEIGPLLQAYPGHRVWGWQQNDLKLLSR